MAATLLPPWMVDRLGWVLVHSLWQFALWAFVAMLLQRTMRRSSATARYATCVLTLGLMPLSAVATWMGLPAEPRAAQRGALSEPTVAGTLPVSHAFDARKPGLTEPTPNPGVAGHEASEARTPASEPPEVTSAASPPSWWSSAQIMVRPWLGEIVLVWCVGVFAFGLRPLASWWMVCRLRRSGVGGVPGRVQCLVDRMSRRLGVWRAVRILGSTLVKAPAVVGYLRPAILLPVGLLTGLPAAQLEAILAHELAHIRRHDYLVNLVQTLLETLFFYHPAVWWLSRRIRQERENCCDDVAVGALGSRVDYCRAILAAAEFRHSQTALALGAGGGSMMARFRRLLDGERGRRPVRFLRPAGAGALAAVLLLGLAVSVSVLARAGSASINAPPANGNEPDGAAVVELPDLVAASRENDATSGPAFENAALSVRIKATDAKTRQPVTSLAVIPAFHENRVDRNTWQSQYLKRYQGNPPELRLERPWEQTVLRIQADGYVPFITRPVRRDEGDVTLDVTLEPDPRLAGNVLLPDGKPAGGASLAICTWTNEVEVEGGILRHSGHGRELGKLGTSAADGSFRLPTEVDPWVLVVAHDGGYAEVTAAEFVKSSTVRLKPWGRIEGEFVLGGKPVAGQPIHVGAMRRGDEVFLHYTGDVVTDAAGRFVVERVPPVTLDVQPWFKHGDSSFNLLWSGRTSVAAGQTTRLTLPRPGRPIVGRVSLPPDSGLSVAEAAVELSVSLRAPSMSGFQDEVDQAWAAYQAFVKSELGRAFHRDKIAANADGTFRIEGLLETRYLLVIAAYRKPASPGADRGPMIARMAKRVEVPPLADSKEPLDLGNLVLSAVERTPPKPPAAPPPKPAKADESKKADAALRVQAEESAATAGPLEIEWLKDLDVLAIRGPRADVEKLKSVIRSLDLKAAPGPGTVDRLNDLLFDKGYRVTAREGKYQVARLTVKFDFRFALWGQTLESIAAQLHLSLKAAELPPGTFTFRDDREYGPVQAIQLLDSVLIAKGYTVARRGPDLVVTKKDRSKYPPRLLAIDNNGAIVKTDASGDVVEVSAGSPADDELLRELSTLPKLRLLNVDSTTRVTPAGLAHIAAMPALESLNLYDLGVTDDDLRHIAKQTGLRELSLAENSVTDVGLERLKDLRNLEKLQLNGNRITDAGLVYLAGLTKLRELGLRNTSRAETGMKITDKGMEHLRGLKALREIDISGTAVTDAGLAYLAGFPELELLSLSGRFITDQGMTHVAACRKLKSLILMYTEVGDEGLRRLAPLKELQRLDLSSYRVTDAGVKALRSHPKLDHVSLRSARVTNAALEHLAAIPSLTRLDLNGSGEPGVNLGRLFDHEGLARLESLPRLRELWLHNLRLGPSEIAALGRLRHLKSLVIDFSDITIDGLRTLRRLLPTARVSVSAGGGFLDPLERLDETPLPKPSDSSRLWQRY